MSLQTVARASPVSVDARQKAAQDDWPETQSILNATKRLANGKDEGGEQQIFEVALLASSW